MAMWAGAQHGGRGGCSDVGWLEMVGQGREQGYLAATGSSRGWVQPPADTLRGVAVACPIPGQEPAWPMATGRVGKPWKRLPGEGDDTPSLSVFKRQLDNALNNML